MMMALNGAGARDSHYGKILMVKSNVDNKQPQSSFIFSESKFKDMYS